MVRALCAISELNSNIKKLDAASIKSVSKFGGSLSFPSVWVDGYA
jgi:hypothetical protein